MELERLPDELTVCRLSSITAAVLALDFCFLGKTDQELSLVCRTSDVPENTTHRADGWRGFRIRGTLDFSLIGILSRLSGVLAENGIGLFAVSTYNTDYILVQAGDFERTMNVLAKAGYTVL